METVVQEKSKHKKQTHLGQNENPAHTVNWETRVFNSGGGGGCQSSPVAQPPPPCQKGLNSQDPQKHSGNFWGFSGRGVRPN